MELLDLVVSQLRCTYLQQIANSGKFQARQTEISHNGSAGCHTIGRKIWGSACFPAGVQYAVHSESAEFPPLPGHQNDARRLRVSADHGDPDRFCANLQRPIQLHRAEGRRESPGRRDPRSRRQSVRNHLSTEARPIALPTATWDAARFSSCRIEEADGRSRCSTNSSAIPMALIPGARSLRAEWCAVWDGEYRRTRLRNGISASAACHFLPHALLSLARDTTV